MFDVFYFVYMLALGVFLLSLDRGSQNTARGTDVVNKQYFL